MMAEKVRVTLGNGTAVSDRFLIVAAFPDNSHADQKHTRLFYLNLDHHEKWQHTDWPNHNVSSLCLRKPGNGATRAGCALSDEGFVQIANSAETIEERIPGAGVRDIESDRSALGYVRGIQEIGHTLFVCGYYGQIYRRGESGWLTVSDNLRNQGENTLDHQAGPPEDRNLSHFEMLRRTAHLNAIDGISETEVYTCGLSGHFYQYYNKNLYKIDLDTDVHLLDLHCVTSEEILVCGYNQTLIVGNRNSGFQISHQISDNIEFWSVRKFQGRIYVGTSRGLRRFNGSTFEIVRQRNAGFDERIVVQQIDCVSDNYMWIVGERHVFRFDGQTVERFEHPDNQ